MKSQALGLLAEGVLPDEIARRLDVSPATVRAWKAHATMGTYASGVGAGGGEVVASEEIESARNLKFGLELDMQEALRRHIDQLDPRLHIVDEGKERHVESGFIDILAEDQDGSLVVIELKSGEAGTCQAG